MAHSSMTYAVVSPSTGSAKAAAEILSKHPNMPLKAFWEVLNRRDASTGLAIALVRDPRCGFDRRSELSEGIMESSHLSLNEVDGGATPLMLAALASRADVMEAMLAEVDVDIDAQEKSFEYSVLHVAVLNNCPSCAGLLVAKGAAMDVRDVYGWTPFYWAACMGHVHCLQLLLAEGGDVGDDSMPLLGAAGKGHIEEGIMLLQNGLDIDAEETQYGVTALHTAAERDQYDFIKLLVAEGARVDKVDKQGNRPVDVLGNWGDMIDTSDIIRLLKRHAT